VRSSTSSAAEVRPGRRGGFSRVAAIAGLATRTIRTKGAAYRDLAAYLAQDTRAFLESRVGLAGARVLDLGSGFGEFGWALHEAGALPISLDRQARGGIRPVVADARVALPFRDGGFDGVLCSNLLEHVPSPPALVAEIARVLRPGGWAYLSWTAWFAPLGGHEYSPWHYLGVRPARAIGRHVRLGQGHNVPGVELFPVHVGPTLRGIRRTGAFDIRYAGPRYWPSQTWIVRVPGFRELATWNCLLLLQRRTARVR
jgi:SAM-dependent methyltransferase